MDVRKKYVDLVESKAVDYRWDLSYHVVDVMVSVLMTRDKIWVGGSFVQAVIENNLRQAVLGADDEIVNYIKHMVIARDNFHLDERF